MKKRVFLLWVILVMMPLLFLFRGIFHEHTLGEWQYNGIGHFQECSCGYTVSENASKHIDENRDDACDICRYLMKYEINSLGDLSWYLLYYYELYEYDYLRERNMKFHSIHEMNFKSTRTYNESNTRVKFQSSYFNEYLTALPAHAEYIKSNTDYYSYYKSSGYRQVGNIPLHDYLFETQETIRYGSSEKYCDYQRFKATDSKFKEVNEFYETTSFSKLTKIIYEDARSYNENNLSFQNETVNSVADEISHLINDYLNVERDDYGALILPEDSYFDSIEIKTENDIVYFSIAKNDGKTSADDDIQYSVNGSINLKTHKLSYNIKRSYYLDGELMSYVDYDYDLTLTKEPIDIEFDFNGTFEEIYIETS